MLIHVACPNCSEPYDIADTFAGGVYRCTKCNTLMSVPKKHTPPAATNLAPGMGKAASPDDLEAMGEASSRASSGKGKSSKPVAKATAKPAAKPAAKTPLKPGQKAPPPSMLAAYKWHLVSFAVLVVVVGIIVIVARSMRQEPKVETTVKIATVVRAPESNYAFTYAKDVLTNAKPNVLGLPLTGNTTVVIDGTSEINGVRPSLHKLVTDGLTGKPYDKPSFVIMYANGAEAAKVYSSYSTPVNAPNFKVNVTAFLGKVPFTSRREDVAALKDALQNAVDKSIANQTRHIVLVVGRNLSTYGQNELVKVMEAAFTNYHTHFDLVVVDADATAMSTLRDQVTASQGRTITVTAPQLQTAAAGVK